MLLLHGYLWFRLVRSTTCPGALRRRLTLLTLVLAILPALAVTLRRTLPLDVAAPLDWVAYSWLGIAFYTFLALLVLEPVRLVGSLLSRRKDRHGAPSGGRRVWRRRDGAALPDGGTAPGRGAVRQDGDDMASVTDPSRRLFLARSLAVTAGAVALGTAGTGA